MLTKAIAHFENKIFSLGKQGQLYIVPTLDGFKLLCLNLLLLIIGLAYANNYVLLFNFILFCLFVASMYYTHFNLKGLQVISAKLSPLHSGESGSICFHFKTRSSLGHHFLGIKIKSNNLQANEQNFDFSMDDHQRELKVNFPVRAIKRGVSEIRRITIETLFPFHLFRAFTYFDVDIKTFIYPEKKGTNLHRTSSLNSERNGAVDDYHLKNFQQGDSLKKILWKKYAQTGKLLTKQMASVAEAPVILGFSDENLTTEEKENELSSICYSLHLLYSQNVNYGLALPGLTINPENSHLHLSNCLRALAEYET